MALPCIECDNDLGDNTRGRVTCNECLTQWVVKIDDVGLPFLQEYKPLQSTKVENKHNRVVKDWHPSTPEEIESFLQANPPVVTQDEEPKAETDSHTVCHFCQTPIGYMNSILGEVPGTWLRGIRFESVYNPSTRTFEQLPIQYSVPLPKKVSSCYECMDRLDKVLPHKENLMTDKWTKKTGARKQHFSRKVSIDRRDEARDAFPDHSKRTPSESTPIYTLHGNETDAPLGTVYRWERFNTKTAGTVNMEAIRKALLNRE